MLTRRGLLDFPLPIGAKGTRLKFRREDIESWNSRVGNIPVQQPTAEVETPTERRRQAGRVARGLKEIGVNIKQKGG